MRELLSARMSLNSIENQHMLAGQFDLSNETVDTLLRYVAVPTLEINRPDTKELDAVWPLWKKEIDKAN